MLTNPRIVFIYCMLNNWSDAQWLYRVEAMLLALRWFRLKKDCHEIHGPQRMTPPGFADPLTYRDHHVMGSHQPPRQRVPGA